jgi:hypothetical protein
LPGKRSDTPEPPPHVTHKQIKHRPLKTPRKQSNPSIAYLDLLLFMMNHSFQFHGRDCYLHT